MSRVTKNSGSDYPIAPEGTHLAICHAIAYIGHIKTTFKNVEKWTDQVMFGFELCEEKAVFDENKGEEPFGIWSFPPFTNSISPKAKLNHFISSWRNKKFTDEEFENGYDLTRVVGQPCQISIVHAESKKNDNIYANISAIIAPAKNTTVPPIHNKPYVFDIVDTSDNMKANFYKLPKWIREKVRGSKEYIENNINWPELDDKKTSNIPPSPANDPASSQPNSWDVGNQKSDDLPF